MTRGSYTLEYRCDDGYGLSARRLWEHTELGQINVFRKDISERRELNDAAAFIDVIRFHGNTFWLAGFTLADLRVGRLPVNSGVQGEVVLETIGQSDDVESFVQWVANHLDVCSSRQAVRNQHDQFLPTAKAGDIFGVPFIFSTLQRRLLGMGKANASGEQWLKTVENFQKKGLRTEEFECSDLQPDLAMSVGDNERFSAIELANLCNFKDLRLSVTPVVSDAQRQIRFTRLLGRRLKRTRNLPKAQVGQTRDVTEFDPVLGYRIERVLHDTLWGPESHWQAVMHDGRVIHDQLDQELFSTKEAAATLAALHAKQNFPKRLALGRFSSYAWTGGGEYREWLIPLPHYPSNYLSGHFKVRNVLAHVRCDVRQGIDGERILMLQEVQSDWAQRARRAVSSGQMESGDESPPPFMKEWPALAMKLVLLHAAYHGLDAVAWTRGEHQAIRYAGLGAIGLTELYDRTLPREVNRMIKPFGGACEMLGVFVPTNFLIKQSEDGYGVFTAENVLLGTAPTLEDARAFVPEGAHELLYGVHGVRLPAATRKAILDVGFPAWG